MPAVRDDPREYSRPPKYGRPAGPRAVARALGTSRSDGGVSKVITPRRDPTPAEDA